MVSGEVFPLMKVMAIIQSQISRTDMVNIDFVTEISRKDYFQGLNNIEDYGELYHSEEQ